MRVEVNQVLKSEIVESYLDSGYALIEDQVNKDKESRLVFAKKDTGIKSIPYRQKFNNGVEKPFIELLDGDND